MILALDCHAHIIASDAERYRRTPGGASLPGYDADTLLRDMDAEGVERALLVQRGQAYGDDNSYVCDVAAEAADRLAAVCGIDARRPDCGTRARHWAARGAVGFRVMGAPREETLDWLCGEHSDLLWQAAADLGLPMCVHLFPANRAGGLAALAALADRFASVPVVVDHLANGSFDRDHGVDEPLRALVHRAAVTLKFTTIPLAGLAAEHSTHAVMRAYVSLVGADRLMWGSDITQSDGDYAAMTALAEAAVAPFAREEQAAMLGGTAARIYRLNDAQSRID